MTAASLFNQLKAGKITPEQFLYEVRRDQNLPFISPITTFKEAIKILQNRGIVTEVFEMGPAEGAEKCSCGGNYGGDGNRATSSNVKIGVAYGIAKDSSNVYVAAGAGIRKIDTSTLVINKYVGLPNCDFSVFNCENRTDRKYKF